MPLSPDDSQFLKRIYQDLDDKPLDPGDPRYQPVYGHEGCEDPIKELERRIEYAGSQSLSLFSGFRGSGKTTELFRLRQRLEAAGHVVLYADALEYINPALPIEIQDLLIVLAGAFSDALEKQKIPLAAETYWERLWNWLKTTEVEAKSLEFRGGAVGLKLELSANPTFKQMISKALDARLSDLRGQVLNFFEEGVKAIRKARGNGVEVVFIFDSLEQIRGSLSQEQEVIKSVELLFAKHFRMLELPYIHAVYTVPPWLKFVLPGTNMVLLPCVMLWGRESHRPECGVGIRAFQSLVEKRFTKEGLARFFGPNPWERGRQYLDMCGGHFRDLLLLFRETVLRADGLPVSDSAIKNAVMRVKSNFLPIALDDATWLAAIERERASLLKTAQPIDVDRLTRFLDTHIVLYLKNGDEWYDVHPLIRKEVMTIAQAAAAAETS